MGLVFEVSMASVLLYVLSQGFAANRRKPLVVGPSYPFVPVAYVVLVLLWQGLALFWAFVVLRTWLRSKCVVTRLLARSLVCCMAVHAARDRVSHDDACRYECPCRCRVMTL